MLTGTEQPLIIDTHYWIWFVDGAVDRLGEPGLSIIERYAYSDLLFLSVISVWEVALLSAKRRIDLSRPVRVWVRDALKISGLQVAHLTPEIAIESSHLPGEVHADPADRIIIATARQMGARLLTRDAHIREYAEQGYLTLADL